ncbi:Acyl-CoA binding domain containing 5 [Mactra antiquata]
MATASPKSKFDAAVKVIHSLPKDGPFQPSREMMLLFYGYYKQATEGPCKSPKPSFWDIVKKAKWEAWSKLGDMDKEVAMVNYVEELKKTLKDCTKQWDEMSKNGDPRIVEAMPQTQVVGDFMTVLGNFYEIVDEDSLSKEIRSKSAPTEDGYIIEPSSSTDTSGELVVEGGVSDESNVSLQHDDDDGDDDDDDGGDGDDDNDDVQPETEVPVDKDIKSDTYMNGDISLLEKTSIISSDSDEEFCDTSADLENFLRKQENQTGLINGPNNIDTVTVKPVKSNHVRFADVNGQTSSTNSSSHQSSENIHFAQGFPFISQGSVEGDVTVTMETASLLNSAENVVPSGKLKESISMKLVDANTSGNNSNFGDIVDEGDDPPDGNKRGNKDEKDQKSGSGGSRRSGAVRINLQGSGGRRSLLRGGAGGGGGSGEQGPPPGSNSVSSEQINTILVRLQQDMTNVLDRLNRLEAQTRQASERPRRDSMFNIWPFTSSTGRMAFFFLIWPVLVHIFLTYMFRRRRKR